MSNDSYPDPRINMLEENISAANPVINAISVQIEIGEILVPSLKEGEIIIHGRIIDLNGHGIKNLIVSLVVEGKALDIKSKSEASGYYSLVLPATIADNIKQNDISMYIYSGTVLVYKTTNSIKITDQRQIKFEAVLSEDDIKRTSQLPENPNNK